MMIWYIFLQYKAYAFFTIEAQKPKSRKPVYTGLYIYWFVYLITYECHRMDCYYNLDQNLRSRIYESISSTVWVLMCVMRWLVWEKNLEHCLQGNGFSPEWVLRWVLRLLDTENDLEHSLQVNGFSPEWVLRWVLRLLDWLNDTEHSLQVNGLSPECVLKIACFSKWLGTFFTSKWLLAWMCS